MASGTVGRTVTARKGRWKRGTLTYLDHHVSSRIWAKRRPIPHLKEVPDGWRCEDSKDIEYWVKVARKTRKTAEKRHDRGHKEEASGCSHHTSERTAAIEAHGPAMIVEVTAMVVLSQGARANTSAFWRLVGISQRSKDPSFWIGWQSILRGSMDH
jgi:hypothetical protein